MADEDGPKGDRGTGRRVAVVVVHGVGDTDPGWALDELVDTLAKAHPDQITAEDHTKVYRLSAPPVLEGERDDRFVACARSARLTATGCEVRFYDLHWADLSRIAPGRFNAFLGSFRMIFESHHFIDAMLPKDGGTLVRFLRTVLIWAAAILRGPIVGLSACLMVVGLIYYWLNNIVIGYASNPATLQLMTAVLFWAGLLATLICALVFLYIRRRSADTEWKDLWIAVAVGSVLLAVYGVYLYGLEDHKSLTSRALAQGGEPPMCLYVTRIYYLIQNLRVAWCLLVFAALVAVILLYLRVPRGPGRVRSSAGMAAVSLVVLQSALWLTLISALSIPLIHQANLHQRLGAGSSCNLESLYVSFLGTALLVACVGYAALLTYAGRYLLARAGFLSLDGRARYMPRMLFGTLITTTVLVGAFLQLGVFAIVYVNDVFDNQFMANWARRAVEIAVGLLPWQVDAGSVFDSLKEHKGKFYGVASLTALVASALIVGGFTTAIHITRDLIDHQYSPRLGYSYYMLPRLLFARRGGADANRPRRARIRQRLDVLAEHVICRPPLFTDVVFVTHSQGSVIVYDYLRMGGSQCERLLCVRPHLITFGSPLGHLYRHYFKEYGELDRGIAELSQRLASWTNIYRVDDYVGRRINDSQRFVRNEVIEAGGHINYWCERKLSDIILECIRTPAGAREDAPATP